MAASRAVMIGYGVEQADQPDLDARMAKHRHVVNLQIRVETFDHDFRLGPIQEVGRLTPFVRVPTVGVEITLR